MGDERELNWTVVDLGPETPNERLGQIVAAISNWKVGRDNASDPKDIALATAKIEELESKLDQMNVELSD